MVESNLKLIVGDNVMDKSMRAGAPETMGQLGPGEYVTVTLQGSLPDTNDSNSEITIVQEWYDPDLQKTVRGGVVYRIATPSKQP